MKVRGKDQKQHNLKKKKKKIKKKIKKKKKIFLKK